jgi:hypothetical protein
MYRLEWIPESTTMVFSRIHLSSLLDYKFFTEDDKGKDGSESAFTAHDGIARFRVLLLNSFCRSEL